MNRIATMLLILVAGCYPAFGQGIETAQVRAQVDLLDASTSASTTFFVASLSGGQENPALDVSGKGTGAFSLDASGLHYRITVDGLSGSITGAHFHKASAGTNGGVVRAITSDFSGNTAEGTWRPDDVQALTDELIGDLLAGRLYVNVHTSGNPSGEIRGQVLLSSGLGFMARLSGGNEVPARDVSGTGTGAFVLDAEGLHYWITATGLSGSVSGSHFHRAAAGANGSVVRAFNVEGTSASGVWTSVDGQPLTTELLGDLLAGRIYANLHTAQFPGGELRGQLELVSGVRAVVSLSGDQGVPPRAVDGTGTAVVTFDGAAVGYRLTASSLTGPISNAHFHRAPAGENGGVAHGIFSAFTGNTASGAWTSTGSQPLTAELIQELLAGGLYLNLHTAANPGGEIRGQVVFSPGLVFQAALSGQNVNPAVETQGSGTGGFVWDGGSLSYRVTVNGLNAAVSNAHFHRAAAGVNGGVVREIFTTFQDGTTEGTWSSADAQPLTPALLSDLMDAGLYVNVHSSAHPGGEIRGQVVQPSPTVAGLEVSLSRSIAGRSNAYNWTGTTDANGSADVTVSSADDFRFRRAGAGGYYIVRVSEAGGRVVGEWGSIPVRGGQVTDLVLPVRQQARVSGYTALAAARHAVVVNGPERYSDGAALSMKIGSLSESGTEITVPIEFELPAEAGGADLVSRFDPKALRFETVRALVHGLKVREAEPGLVEISFDGTPAGSVELTFTPVSLEPVSLSIDGVLMDTDLFPTVQHLEVRVVPGAPTVSVLHPNYPNPFNPDTLIPYDVAESGQIVVQVYNAIGQLVQQLVNEHQAAGRYRIRWDASRQASGLYYVELIAQDFRDIRRMMLVK